MISTQPPYVLGHVDAEQQDEERVDLAVDAAAQRGGGAGPARHLPVHPVEDQRDGGQGDQRGDRHRPAERVRNQARDPGDQQRPGQGDPVRRENRRLVAAHAGGDQQRGRRRTGGQPGDPAGDAETGRGGHDPEQGGGGEHPQDRREPDRRQRSFVHEPDRRQRSLVRGADSQAARPCPQTEPYAPRLPAICCRFSWGQRVRSHAGSPRPAAGPPPAAAAGRLNYVPSRPV